LDLISVGSTPASDQRVVTETTLSQLEYNNALIISWLQLGGSFNDFFSMMWSAGPYSSDHPKELLFFTVTVTSFLFLIKGKEDTMDV